MVDAAVMSGGRMAREAAARGTHDQRALSDVDRPTIGSGTASGISRSSDVVDHTVGCSDSRRVTIDAADIGNTRITLIYTDNNNYAIP